MPVRLVQAARASAQAQVLQPVYWIGIHEAWLHDIRCVPLRIVFRFKRPKTKVSSWSPRYSTDTFLLRIGNAEPAVVGWE